MNSLSDSFNKAKAFADDLPPSGKWTLAGVPLALAAGFALLLTGNVGGGDEVPVSWGKVFASNELRSAEQALIEADLTDFRTRGQRIFVPAAEVDAYNAALMVDGRLPGDSLSEFERQFDKAGLFTSREQLAGLRDIALRKEVRKTLAAVPDIESADVLWSVKQSGEWPRREKKTAATVSLMPRRGAPLPPERVSSIRRAVANMVPDLAEEDVTVFDQSTGTAHAHAEGGPLDDRTQTALAAHTKRYRDTITQALAYIPGALVNVSVDLDSVRRQVERTQSVDAKQTVTLEAEESARTLTSNQTRPQGEPGVASNRPASVAVDPGPLTQLKDERTDSNVRVVPSWTTTERELREAMPEAVRVAVSIPESYHEAVAAGRGLTPGEDDAAKSAFVQAVDAIRVAEEAKVRERIATLLPAGSPPTAVHVATVTPIRPDVPVVETPWTATVGGLLDRWGSALALIAVALVGLFVLRRGMTLPEPEPALAEPDATDRPGVAGRIGPGGATEDEEEPKTPRDRVAKLAAEDPEAVAAVIGSWLRNAA